MIKNFELVSSILNVHPLPRSWSPGGCGHGLVADELYVRALVALWILRIQELVYVKSFGALSPPVGMVWYRLRCHLHHLTVVLNYEVCHLRVAFESDINQPFLTPSFVI
ncbi:hypothetical protein TNCV_4044211 [Trichonephila clavipes]|nr:hypothetical protein TNCV_4044211 [Trichonephila clavipes]